MLSQIVGSWETWRQDLRHAGRGLGRTPGFAVAAVLTLAVGLTGSIVIFALIRGVLLRPLPVPHESRLFVGWRALPEAGARHWPFRAAELDFIRRESRQFESVAGVGYNEPGSVVFVDRDASTFVLSARVTGEFFEALGVEPIIGRALTPEDDRTGSENVLVITHKLWQRRYGGSREVLGRRVLIDGQPFTIVGVMPPDVDHPRQVEAWMTVAARQTAATIPTFREAMRQELDLLARLREGVTAEQASAELKALAPRLEQQQPPGDPRGLVPLIQSYRQALVGDVRQVLLVLFAAVGFVLLVASANVANLLLMRGEGRRPEFAVRAALGATRGRLARQVLAESGVLASMAGASGLTAAIWALPLIVRWLPEGLPRVDGVRVDAPVALFSFVLTLVAVSLAGLVPALASTKIDLAAGLHAAVRSTVRHNGRRALVVWQVALAMTVVSAAGLLTRSMLHLQAVGIQLASDRLVYVPLDLPQAKYADRGRREQLMTELTARLDATPPIVAATPINGLPFSGLGWDAPTFTAEGQTRGGASTNPTLNLEEIYPQLLQSIRSAIAARAPVHGGRSPGRCARGDREQRDRGTNLAG